MTFKCNDGAKVGKAMMGCAKNYSRGFDCFVAGNSPALSRNQLSMFLSFSNFKGSIIT
jgi:hypothetical protein